MKVNSYGTPNPWSSPARMEAGDSSSLLHTDQRIEQARPRGCCREMLSALWAPEVRCMTGCFGASVIAAGISIGVAYAVTHDAGLAGSMAGGWAAWLGCLGCCAERRANAMMAQADREALY